MDRITMRWACVAALVVVAACGSAESTSGGETSSTTTAAGHQHPRMTEEEAAEAAAERPTNAEFNGPERVVLAEQLVRAREVALSLPTYADALAAGYEPTTPYAPGTGSHMGKDADTQPPGAELDISRPQSFLYAGTEPASPVVGLMYVQLGGDAAPDGFSGPLDTWEAFVGQCLDPDELDPLFPTAADVSEEKCSEAGGRYIDVTAWIQHVWVVPGWEAPGGVFAPYNDDIVCADGTTDSTDADGCEAPAGGLG